MRKFASSSALWRIPSIVQHYVSSVQQNRKLVARDFAASIVVFLVAMPLCMGIAVASGVPPEKGLITGIIGGLVVGFFAGSPLQVSGPAAGLAVLVFEIVAERGVAALGPILLLAGGIQLLAGVAKLGGWFRAISPAVVHGMLAGIGVLICAAQFHMLFDHVPRPNGMANVLAIPDTLLRLVGAAGNTGAACATGVVTIAALLLWEKWRPASLKLIPGALVGVLLATLLAYAFDLQVQKVQVPESLLAAVSMPSSATFMDALSPAMFSSALALAFIASAETLLSAAAVDRMHDGPRTDYNKELRAQGIGNLLCGVCGGLPMTGVIVRSSANVQAGAATRLSTILHGLWILACVIWLAALLRMIPMAALAGVLVVTGWRLVSLRHARHLLREYGVLPAVIWAGTLVMVVTTDLLTGVLTGLALSLLELLPNLRQLRLQAHRHIGDQVCKLQLSGSATFITLPKLTLALEGVPNGAEVHVDVGGLRYLDHTCTEVLREWFQRKRREGARLELTGLWEEHPHQRRLAAAVAAGK